MEETITETNTGGLDEGPRSRRGCPNHRVKSPTKDDAVLALPVVAIALAQMIDVVQLLAFQLAWSRVSMPQKNLR